MTRFQKHGRAALAFILITAVLDILARRLPRNR